MTRNVTNPWVHLEQLHDGVNLGFTSVSAGNLALHLYGNNLSVQQRARITAHRRGLEATMGVPSGSVAYLNQVHSNTVVSAEGLSWGLEGSVPDADAMISSDGSHPLAIMVADCLPVVFVADHGATAVTHAGRVGLLDGVLENTVKKLRNSLSTSSSQIRAWIGPAICGRCYEVPAHMCEEMSAQYPLARSKTSWGTHALDLPRAARGILVDLGIDVTQVPICTFEDTRVFSHRREPGQGRCAGVVWRSSEES